MLTILNTPKKKKMNTAVVIKVGRQLILILSVLDRDLFFGDKDKDDTQND